MTNTPNSPDLPAIAYEAEVEILAAEAIQDTGGDPEIGYYEAELRSLRDAATTLDAAERLT
jgi:hypothetical protein